MKKIKILFIILLLLIFFLIAFNINSNFIEKMDSAIYSLIFSLNGDFITTLFKVITFLSNPEFVLIALVICFIFIKNKKIKNFIVLNSVLIVSLNQIVKAIIARPRPSELMIIKETGYSFPSAHAMFSLAFYGVLLYYLMKTNINKKIKIFLGIILLFLIILIPVTRVYLGVHYASDVIAGMCLSGAILLIYSVISEKNDKKANKSI